MAEGAAAQVCAACLGNQWRIFLVDRQDGRRPDLQVRACWACNSDGKRGVGITLIEPFDGEDPKRPWIPDFNNSGIKRFEYDPLNGLMASKKDGAFVLYSDVANLEEREKRVADIERALKEANETIERLEEKGER